MKKIVFLDQGTLLRQKLDFEFPYALTNHEICPADVSRAINGHEIVITNKVKINREHMLANPQLKLIAVSATGYNIIDVDAARELGVTVCNVSGYSTVSVAEHTFMLMIALMHRLPLYQQRVALDQWQNSPHFYIAGEPIFDLAGKTLGIIGKGEIGRALASRALAFDMKVIFAEHKHASTCRAGYEPFESVLNQADVLSVLCPLTAETLNLIDQAELEQMKDGVILLNTSRGGLVNEAALAAALMSGKLGGAGVDALTTEPPPGNHPLLNHQLGNFILTPHTAWASEESIDRLVKQLQNNINAFVKGTPVNVVS